MAAPSETKGLEFIARSFIAGGVSGMCAKTSIAPLDRVKILLQAHNVHYKHLGVVRTLKHIVIKENFLALYKSNGAQMVRIFPYAAVQFMSYEQYKKIMTQFFGQHSHISKMIAGSCAGVSAVTVTYPLDMVRARLAFQVTGEHVYTGISHTLRSIVTKEGGVRALYKGFSPTILGMIPYAGISFYTFERLKLCLLETWPAFWGKPNPSGTGHILNIPAKLLCGGLAGAFAQSVSYPMDVARRRMQLSEMMKEGHAFRTWHGTLLIVWRQHGIVRGLYRGMTINYIRVIPMMAVSFSTYEVMKQLLKLDTGVDTSS